jgi:hypothetical protein
MDAGLALLLSPALDLGHAPSDAPLHCRLAAASLDLDSTVAGSAA